MFFTRSAIFGVAVGAFLTLGNTASSTAAGERVANTIALHLAPHSSLSACTPSLKDGEPAVVTILLGGINTQLLSGSWEPLHEIACPDDESGPNTLSGMNVVTTFSNDIPSPNTDLVQFLAENGAVVLPFSYASALTVHKAQDGNVWASLSGYDKSQAGGEVLPDKSNSPAPGTAAYYLNKEVKSVHAVWPKSPIFVIGHSNGGLVAERWWQDVGIGTHGASGVVRVLALDSPINGVPNPCAAQVPGVGKLCTLLGIEPPLGAYYNRLWNNRAKNDLLITSKLTPSAPTLTLIGTQNDLLYVSVVGGPDWSLVPQMAFAKWRKDGSPYVCKEHHGGTGGVSLSCPNLPSPDIESKALCNALSLNPNFDGHGQVITCPATQALIVGWMSHYTGRSATAWSTYVGGSSYDYVRGMASDAAGNLYITGQTNSADLPGRTNSCSDCGGPYGRDAFVAKLNPANGAIDWSTYVGGTGETWGNGIAVARSGAVYITGLNESPNLPDATNAWVDPGAFITKLAGASGAIVYTTYLSHTYSEAYPSDPDMGNGIALDGAGNAYVVGATTGALTNPTNAYNPGCVSAYSDCADAFVAKVSAASGAILWSTYVGGSYDDHGNGIALDAAGGVYITGDSSSPDLPSPTDKYNSSCDSGGVCDDAFVTKLSSDTGTIAWSTYVGANGGDGASGIAVDATGHAYISGAASGGLPNGPDSGLGGFVAKISTSSGAITWATYVASSYGGASDGGCGGEPLDGGCGVVLDTKGNVYFAGNYLLAKVSAAGSFLWSSYLGGNGYVAALVLEPDGSICVDGYTESANLQGRTNSYNPGGNDYGGHFDGYVSKLIAPS